MSIESIQKENIRIALEAIDNMSIEITNMQLAITSYIQAQVNTSIEQQIIDHKNCFFNIEIKAQGTNNIVCITRISNYKIEILRNIVVCNINDTYNPEEVELEIIATNTKNEKTKPMKLKGISKKSIRDFREKLYSYGNFVDVISEKQFAQIFDQLYKKTEISVNYCYNTPGLIPNKNIWLLDNAIIDLKTSQIIERKR